MAKDPAFPFYAQDFLIDTLRWDRGMKSLHIDLLAESWINGGLVDEQGFPFGLTTVDQQLWLRIKHKWTLVNGVWINERLELVREERIAFRQKQSDKGKKSAEARKNKGIQPLKEEKNNSKNPSSIVEDGLSSCSTAVEPIEDEKENENERENRKRKKSEKKKSEHLFSESPFIDFDFFEQQFIGTDYEVCDLRIYHEKVKNWSASKGAKKVDWIATARNFMMSDKENGKLALKSGYEQRKQQGGSSSLTQFGKEIDELIARKYGSGSAQSGHERNTNGDQRSIF